jgi:hypothetical protein
MKIYPHPRPLPVLRRAPRSLVSSGQNPADAALPSLPIGPRRATAPLHPTFRKTDPAQLSLFLIPLHPLSPIQST